jgi:hypothetical protein
MTISVANQNPYATASTKLETNVKTKSTTIFPSLVTGSRKDWES